jgi:UDP-N-acetylglucosamine acyltransferase
MALIHSTALIGNGVSLGDGVSIGAYSILGDGVNIGDGTAVADRVVVGDGVNIGANCSIGSFSVIGKKPWIGQNKGGCKGGVEIGDGVYIEEHVIIPQRTDESLRTEICSGCVIKSFSHVGHDASVGKNTIIGNGCLIGGFSKIGDWCRLGNGVAIRQSIRLGNWVHMPDNGATGMHVPPCAIATMLSTVIGFNGDDLSRAGIGEIDVEIMKKCFREFCSRSGNVTTRARRMVREGWGSTAETAKFLRFFLVEASGRVAPMVAMHG